jgi:hypothetical protein
VITRSRRFPRPRPFLLLQVGLAATAGCADDRTAPSPAAPAVTYSAIDESRGSIFRSVTVELEEPTGIRLEYWAPGTPRLRLDVAETSQRHTVFIPRLRAATRYEMTVQSLIEETAGAMTSLSFRTDSLPADLAAVRLTARGTSTAPLFLLELREPYYCAIADADGEIVWYYPAECQGATRRTNGNFVLVSPAAGFVYDVGIDGRLQHSLQRGGSLYGFHHDAAGTAHNTILVLTLDTLPIADTLWHGEAVWEWDPEAGTTTWRWAAHDVWSPATDRGPRSQPTDWLHANSIHIGPRGNLLISMHFMDQVASIAPDFQSIEWRLGGPNATKVPTAAARFSGQHTAAELPNGNVLMFDNGFDRADGSRFSRALELGLDADSAYVVWEYRSEIYASFISSARRLDNGNTVIGYGPGAGQLNSSGPVAAREVTPAGHAVWTLLVENAASMFRAEPLHSIGGEVIVP